MRIEFTAFAETQLKEIFAYYKSVVSETTALLVVGRLLDTVEDLGRLPSIGSIEPHLKSLKQGHRYIVCGNYKVIFFRKGDVIYVTDIFDCRQNPVKIARRNKRSS